MRTIVYSAASGLALVALVFAIGGSWNEAFFCLGLGGLLCLLILARPKGEIS